MAAAAIIGLSRMPAAGWSAPAATGTPSTEPGHCAFLIPDIGSPLEGLDEGRLKDVLGHLAAADAGLEKAQEPIMAVDQGLHDCGGERLRHARYPPMRERPRTMGN